MIEVMYREWKLLWRYDLYVPGSPERRFLLHVLLHLDNVLPLSVSRKLPPLPVTTRTTT